MSTNSSSSASPAIRPSESHRLPFHRFPRFFNALILLAALGIMLGAGQIFLYLTSPHPLLSIAAGMQGVISIGNQPFSSTASPALCFTADGKSLAICDTRHGWKEKGGAYLFDLQTGKELRKLYDNSVLSTPVRTAAFPADGRRFVLAGWGTAANTVDLTQNKFVPVTAPDRAALISPSVPEWLNEQAEHFDNRINYLDLQNHRKMMLKNREAGSNAALRSMQGRYAMAESITEQPRLWNAATGESLFVLPGHHLPVRHFAFSTDNRFAATADADGTVRVWETANGRKVQELRIGRPVVNLLFFPRDNRMVTVSPERLIQIWPAPRLP